MRPDGCTPEPREEKIRNDLRSLLDRLRILCYYFIIP